MGGMCDLYDVEGNTHIFWPASQAIFIYQPLWIDGTAVY